MKYFYSMKEFIKWVLAVLCGLAVWGIIKIIMFFMMIGSMAGLAASGASSTALPKEGVLVIDMATLAITEQTTQADIISTIQNTELSQVGIRVIMYPLHSVAPVP